MKRSHLSRRRFLASSAGVAASGLVLGSTGMAQANTPIRIGVGADPVYTAFYLAQHEGLFEAENANVDLQLFTDGGEAMNALVAQQLDVSSASEPSSFIRMARAEIRPLAISYTSGKYIKLMLGKEVEKIEDIKKMGIVPGSVSEYCAGLTLEKYGMSLDEVTYIPSGPPELPALLARGDIDGFFAWEPWPTKALVHGGKVALTSSDVGYADTIWVSSSAAMLDSNPEGLQAMLRALAKASDIARAEPERAAAAVKAMVSLPEETTLEILKQMTLQIRDFTDADYESYDGIAQFLSDHGVTDGPIAYRDMLQRGFFKA